MNKIRISLEVMLLVITVATGAAAAELVVPSPQYPTIQSGLNAAQTGDSVLVAPGEYHESLFWPFRNGITLLGAGMDSTIVVGNQLETVVYMIYATIDSTTAIRGVSIRNGGDSGITLDTASPLIEFTSVDSVRGGPGILCLDESRAIVRRSRIANTTGNGIRCETSSPIVVGNTIRDNAVPYGSPSAFGAGIYCSASSPTILGNSIIDNAAGMYGGGIYCSYSSPAIVGNTISGNSAQSAGGGICCVDLSSPTIADNVILGNFSENGGGVFFNTSALMLNDNVIVGNTASSNGGGVYCNSQPETVLRGNIIAANHASSLYQGGGGIYCYYSSFVITENIIASNTAAGDGGAVYLDNSSPQLTWNTITENAAVTRGDAVFTMNSLPTVTSCNIAYNGWGCYNQTAGSIPDIQGNWWGDVSGPWHGGMNPSGTGDSLSTYAWDFIPWAVLADTLAPPMPPRGLWAAVETGDPDHLVLHWEGVPLADLAGYRVYFDSDAPGFPYSGSIDVGNTTEYILDGLTDWTRYYLAVTSYDRSGNESWYSREIVGLTSDVGEMGAVGQAVRLERTFPNPFHDRTAIRFVLTDAERVRITVHSITGQLIETLADGIRPAGSHTVYWGPRDRRDRRLAAGVYLLRMETRDGVATTKAILTP